MILLIDNYDSFVHNLARYFERLGQTTQVVRHDAIDADGVRACQPQAVVLSPGPCTPAESGCCREIVNALIDEVPILGVCLGHQTIAAALGARIVPAAEPMHGRTSDVTHDGQGVFQNLPSPLKVGRYHSLTIEPGSLPACLEVTARADDGTVMAIRHRARPVVGLQFHPESVLTSAGYALLAGFLRLANLGLPSRLPTIDDERMPPRAVNQAVPAAPVTF